MKSRVFRTIPRKKHPNRFTERIPKGIKEEEIFDVINSDVKTLETAPKAPPKAIKIYLIFPNYGGPSATRTQDQFLRRELLYQTELTAQIFTQLHFRGLTLIHKLLGIAEG